MISCEDHVLPIQCRPILHGSGGFLVKYLIITFEKQYSLYCTDCKRADREHDKKEPYGIKQGDKIICKGFNSGITLETIGTS